MDKRSYRRFTAEEKRTILEEIQQPGVTLSEVCHKNRVSPGLVYRWRAVTQQATTEALQQVDRKNHYGSKSERGTQVAAVLYSLIETARQLGVDERQYLLSAARFAMANPGGALLPHALLS